MKKNKKRFQKRFKLISDPSNYQRKLLSVPITVPFTLNPFALKPIDYDNPIDLLSSDHIRVQPHLNAILVTESRPIIRILSGFYPFEILPGVLLLCRSSKLFSSLMFELLFICLLDRIFSIPRVAVTGLSPDKSTLKTLLVS